MPATAELFDANSVISPFNPGQAAALRRTSFDLLLPILLLTGHQVCLRAGEFR